MGARGTEDGAGLAANAGGAPTRKNNPFRKPFKP